MKKFSSYGYCHGEEKPCPDACIKWRDPVIKGRVLMRINLIVFLFFLGIVNVCASGFAQSVTLSFRNKPLIEVLNEIKRQSGYELIYNSKHFSGNEKITVSIENEILQTALEKCLEGLPFTFHLIDKTIVITRMPGGVKEKIKVQRQKIIITGKVLDEKGNTLAGVNVKVKTTDTKSVTNEQGIFNIEVLEIGSILQFSFVGYQSLEHKVIDENPISITLIEEAGQLKEVGILSTGYQQLPKERATGSFVQIDNKLLNRKVSTNILERLDGISPGVFFNGTTSNRIATTVNNRNAGITVRGQNSFSTNTAQPLIVVDNFPYEGEINNINPNDIENITVLKDAAAASIWGARSGNGVIVITTKKGAKNQKIKVEFNSNVTIVNKPDLSYSPDFLNAGSYIEVEKILFDAGFFNSDISNKTARPTVSPGIELFAQLRSAKTKADSSKILGDIESLKSNDVRQDYEKYIYRKAINQQYSLGVRGGGNDLAYSLSFGYDKNLNTLIENSFNRITINSTNTYTPIKNLDITASINYSQNNTIENNDFGYKQYSGVAPSKYNYIYPYARLVDDFGQPLSIDNGIRASYLDEMETKGFLDWHYRPLNDIRNNDYSTSISDLLFRLSAKYKILPQLNAEVLYQNEKQIIDRVDFKSLNAYYTRNLINKFSSLDPVTGKVTYVLPLGGIRNQGKYDWKAYNVRGQLNYDQEFDKNEISGIAGIELRELANEGFTRLSYGYDDQFGTSVSALDYLTNYPVNPSGTARIPSLPSDISGFTNRYLSYFANAAYTYDKRYTLTLSGRKDGANIFGVNTNDRITPLWSTGIGWNISKESFYESMLVPFLRLRASYGFNGNVNRNGTAFLTGNYSVDPITGAKIITGATAPNPELRWEKIKNINIGIDFRSKDNIITGSIEGFYKKGFDLFQATALAPQTGFTSYTANAANSRSEGFDINIQSQNLNGKIGWNSSLLLSTLWDKVVKYDPPINANTIANYGFVVGYPMYSVFSYKWAGLNSENGNPLGYLNGKVSEDYGAIRNNYNPDSLVYNGSARPAIFGALRNDFTYKGFSLSINITYKLGYVFRRNSVSLNYRDILTTRQNMDYNKRWQKPGDELVTIVPSLVYPNNSDRNNFYQYSDVLIEKGDHIRLQDIRLAYLFPRLSLLTTAIKQLQVYAYGNNVGILWRKNKSGLDPDANLYPNPFSFSIGLSANF